MRRRLSRGLKRGCGGGPAQPTLAVPLKGPAPRAVLLVRHAAPPPPQGHPVRALPSSVQLRGGYKTKSAPLLTQHSLASSATPQHLQELPRLLSDSSMCLATQQQVPAPPHPVPAPLVACKIHLWARSRIAIASMPLDCVSSTPYHLRSLSPIAPAHESESFTIRGTCESLRYPRARTLYGPLRLQLACVYACSSHALPPTPIARSESGDTCRAAAWY